MAPPGVPGATPATSTSPHTPGFDVEDGALAGGLPLPVSAPLGGSTGQKGAPRILKATLARVSRTRSVRISVVATGPLAVTRLRTANEDGRWGSWTTYRANKPVAHRLTAGKGRKVVLVQALDAAGRTSTFVVRHVRLV